MTEKGRGQEGIRLETLAGVSYDVRLRSAK